MEARTGDRLVILSRRIHEPVRDGVIVEVRGGDGQPPYVVRWSDTNHETLIYPGADAIVEPARTTPPDIDALGRAALDADGEPTVTRDEAVALLRHHIDLETMRTTDHDDELWKLWEDEASRAQDSDHNADVLDRVLARLRVGE